MNFEYKTIELTETNSYPSCRPDIDPSGYEETTILSDQEITDACKGGWHIISVFHFENLPYAILERIRE
jgi:hypothetical protein